MTVESSSQAAGQPIDPNVEGVARIVPLTAADVPEALALSVAAQWNQNDADWRMMLRLGHGWGLRVCTADGRETLAASTIVLPYGDDFAWTSMVLVLPEFRRRGCASFVLRQALTALQAEGRSAILDATPAGHAVYVQEGFTDTWGFARYRRGATVRASVRAPGASGARPAEAMTIRPLQDTDWKAIADLDRPAFGASRLPLLQALAARLPAVARVAEDGAGLRGFVLGRDGREASQIGPLVADDGITARLLLSDAIEALDGAVYLDLLDERKGWCDRLLHELGFTVQRPFTRMVHGRGDAPGDAAMLWLVAGPELG